jgi:hypothetical protein
MEEKLWKGAGRVKFLVMTKFTSSFKWLRLPHPTRCPAFLKDRVDFFYSYEIEISGVIRFALSSV